jgi:ABC-type molybdate transport system substrate-binding protein
VAEGVQVHAEQEPHEEPRIACPVAALRSSAEPELARAFVSFLGEQADLFEQYGFLVTR